MSSQELEWQDSINLEGVSYFTGGKTRQQLKDVTQDFYLPLFRARVFSLLCPQGHPNSLGSSFLTPPQALPQLFPKNHCRAGSSQYGIRPFVYLNFQRLQSSVSRIILILQVEYIPFKSEIPCNYSVKWHAPHIHRTSLAEGTKHTPKALNFYWEFLGFSKQQEICLCLFCVPNTFHKLFHLVSGRQDFSAEVVE